MRLRPVQASSIRRTSCSVLVRAILICIVLVDNVQAQTSTNRERIDQAGIGQAETNGTFTLNLNNVDIYSLIETVSRHTGKNFVVDPRVNATVSIVSSEPVSADKLYKLFLSALEIHGFAAVSSGIITKIVPTQVGVQSAVPTVTTEAEVNQIDTGDQLVTRVVKLNHIPAQQLLEILRPMIPAPASIAEEPKSNQTKVMRAQ